MSTLSPQQPNPFPGLRPFRSDEHHLFFGREEQTAALLQRLRQNRFLAVVGTSGSGKSSLVRAGMIAELHGGTMTQAGSAWEVMILRPGGSPIENLARAMVEADLYDAEESSTLPRLKATLSRSRFGLVEAMKQSDVFEPGTNLLVVVDQFEELFRFRQQGVGSEEASTAFVNLLLTASEQAECPIYVTITMRSDYLGDCSEIPGLAEAVNDGEYLIPRLLRDQKRDAIEKPIGVGGARISPLLVQRLLNDVGDDPDQLPVLQHALMRMWEVWATGGDHERPIDLSDFEATGGLAAALSNHADEIYDALPDDHHRSACEKIFKTLTEKGDDNRGIRRPTRLPTLQAITGADRETVTTVLDAFRRPGVTFLMPGVDTELSERTVLDLSHESLMRGWQRLRSWVEDEAQSARIFRRLLDTARLWSDNKAGLFRDPDLQIALSWREEEQPNADWAEQYGGHFETAIGFLESSNAEAESERQAKEAARQRELEHAQQLVHAERRRASDQARAAVRLRWLVRGLGVVALVALTATVFAWLARQEANRNAEVAAQKAADAEQQRRIALGAKQETEAALTEAQKQKEQAELAEKTARLAEGQAKENEAEAERQRAAALEAQERTAKALITAESAKAEAEEAERRSREFRYATDMQLAAARMADETANAAQILKPLSDHDPTQNKDQEDREDLRGFEWYYLKRLVESGATIFDGFDKDVVAWALTAEGQLLTLDGDARLQRWDTESKEELRPAIDLKKGRNVTTQILSQDGRWAALAIGDNVHLVDTATGDESGRVIPAKTRGGLMFSPDGQMLITVDTGIGWWDAATAKPIAVDEFGLTAYAPAFHPVSVSADGRTVAVGGQGNYRGYFSVFRVDPETRGIARLLDKVGADSTKRTLAISPDGETVAISLFFAGGLYLYDTATGRASHFESSAHTASISAIAFDPNSSRLVTASMDGAVKLWENYKELATTQTTALVGHVETVDTVAFVADGKQFVTTGKDATVRLWDPAKTKQSLYQKVDLAVGARARYSSNGMLMAVSGDNLRLQLRDGMTGQVVARLSERDNELSSNSIAFSPDNCLLAVGFGGQKNVSFVELWDMDRRQLLAKMPGTTAIPGFDTTEYSGLVTGLAFSSDGKHLAAGFGSLNLLGGGDHGNHPLLVYDVASRRIIRRLEGHRYSCVSIKFSRDGSRMASASYDGTARIWDAATWQALHVLPNPDVSSDRGQRRVHDIAFSPDGTLLAMASAEGNVIIWDVTTGQQLRTLSGHTNEVWSVAFAPDGRTLASGSTDGTIRLWNVATWRELVYLEASSGFDPKSLDFSPDGSRLLAAALRGEALAWSIRDDNDEFVAAPEQLATWLEPGVDFQNRIRMHSENLRLRESLESLATQHPENDAIQAGVAATRANWHASRDQWEQAAAQFDHLKRLSPDAPDAWLRTPGLLRLATALLHQHRPAEAARLLTGGEARRAEDGSGNRSVAFGFVFDPSGFPLKLTRVMRGGPAWVAGLRAGDTFLKFNDVELTAETYGQYSQITSGAEGTKVTMTVQRPGHEEPLTFEMTKASHIQDDLTVELIETLFELVNQNLAESPGDPCLLELRAELAGQSSDRERQIADYTAAIQALSELPEDQAGKDLARLYRRRGSAYVGLKRWRAALDDYAKGVTGETIEENLLANLVTAQAELESRWTVLKPVEMTSEGGATLTELDDGSILASGVHPDHDAYTVVADTDLRAISAIRIEALTDESHPKKGPGRSSAGFFVMDRFELQIAPQETPDDKTPVPFGAVKADYFLKEQPINPQSGKWHTAGGEGQPHVMILQPQTELTVEHASRLTFRMTFDHGPRFPQLSLGRFRLSVSDDPAIFDKAEKYFTPIKSRDPWTQLASAYLINGNQLAIDQLVERRPQAAGDIGDLFLQGEEKDWQRAVEIYGKGITPETTDEELLAKRAEAYEQLQDWNAAAADWSRAADANPEGAKLLADFAGRLVKADQVALAAPQRDRARQLLETTLKADPGDDPAVDTLAALLLDMSEPRGPKWSALKPADLKTASGATVAVQDNDSLVVQHGSHTITLPDAGNPFQTIRIETSPDAAASGGDAAFKEYRLLSVNLPANGFRGRYVRIDLPGENEQFPRLPEDGAKKVLALAEVQVFAGDKNVALGRTARQSSRYSSIQGGPESAVDGNTDGAWENQSVTATQDNADDRHPWWEVDLGAETDFDRVVIWNRDDSVAWKRMSYFRIRILDASRQVVYERFVEEAPQLSMQINRRVQLARIEPEEANDHSSPWQVSLDGNRDLHAWRRFRISMSEQLAALPADAIETTDLKWTVPEPAKVTPAAGTKLAAQADGSFLLDVAESDSLALPVLPAAVKAIRVETAGASGSDESALAAFKDYRIEAVGASRSEFGALQGRYVRIDLPGDSKEFPRHNNDGVNKILNLAEVQVFQDDENIAQGKMASQSSTNGDNKAERAVDGNTDGTKEGKSITTTNPGQDGNDPWWEVDLGSSQSIDRLVIWTATWGKAPERLRHLRVRIMDHSHDVVFEQKVADEPQPSKEISCRSLLVTSAADADQTRWSLRLNTDTGIDARGPFRISSAEELFSLAQEEAIAEARKISQPAARLAAAYDLNGVTDVSVNWFGRALDDAAKTGSRKLVLEHLEVHPEVLPELLKRRPDDRLLQVTQGRALASRAKEKLASKQPDEALGILNKAHDLYASLLEQNPEPQWTVLKPIDLKSEGGAELTLQPDGSILASGDNPKNDAYVLTIEAPTDTISALLLEAIPSASMPGGGVGRGSRGSVALTGVSLSRLPKPGGRPVHAAFSAASADIGNPHNAMDANDATYWAVNPDYNQPHQIAIQLSEPLETSNHAKIVVRLEFGSSQYSTHGLGHFRLSVASELNGFAAAEIRHHLTQANLADLDVVIGQIDRQQDRTDEAAAAFSRALDRVAGDKEQKQILDQLRRDETILLALAKQRPENVQVQLALARIHAENGKKALAEQRPAEALSELERAQEIHRQLLAKHPPPQWTVLEPTEMTSEGGAELTLQSDGSIFVSGENAVVDTYTLTAPIDVGDVAGIRLETIPDQRLPAGAAGRADGHGEFLLAEIKAALGNSDGGPERPLELNAAFADFSRINPGPQPVTNALNSDPASVWGIQPRDTEPHVAIFMLSRTLEAAAASQRLKIQLRTGIEAYPRRNLGRFRLSVTSDTRAIEVARFQQELKDSGSPDLEISLANAYGGQGRIDEAATAFSRALDQATDRDAKAKVLQEASARDEVLGKLTALRPEDASFHDVLARHFQTNGDFTEARAAAATARTLYEQQLAAEPANATLAKDLADLLLEVSPVEWTVLKPTEMKSEGGADLTFEADGSIFVSGKNPDIDTYTIAVSNAGPIAVLKLETIPDSRLPHGGAGRSPQNGDFSLSELKVVTRPGAEDSEGSLKILDVFADHSQKGFPLSLAVDGITSKAGTGAFWNTYPEHKKPHVALFALAPVTLERDANTEVHLLSQKGGAPHLNLGRFRLSLCKDATAFAIERDLIAASQVTPPWARLGAAFRALGEFDKALDAFSHSIELANTDEAKAAVAQEAAPFEDIFSQLLERFPDDKALRLGQAKYLAAKLITEKQLSEAVEVLTGALEEFPEDIQLLTLRADAHSKFKHWESALADLSRLIDLQTDSNKRRQAERQRAEVYFRLGQWPEAAEFYTEEMLLAPNFGSARDASVSQSIAGNPGVGKMAAAAMYRKLPNDLNAGQANWLVRVLTAAPGLVTTENRQKLLDAAKTAGGAWTAPMTAAIHYRLGELEQAQPLLTSSADKPQFLSLAAEMLYGQGQPERALEYLRQANDWLRQQRERDPGNLVPEGHVWQHWAVYLATQREVARKLAGPRLVELDALLEAEPENHAAIVERATLFNQYGLYEQALQELGRVSALLGDSAELLSLRGRVLTELQRHPEQALADLNKAIEFDSTDALAYAARGGILLRRGESEEARRDLQRSMDLEPTEQAARHLADLLLGEAEKAIGWTVLKPTEMKSEGGATLTLLDDGSVLASGVNPTNDVYVIEVPVAPGPLQALLLEVMPDPSLPGQGPGRGGGTIALTGVSVSLATEEKVTPVALVETAADIGVALQAIDGNTSTFWGIWPEVAKPHRLLFRLQEPTTVPENARITIRLEALHGQYNTHNLGRFRLSVSDDPAAFERERKHVSVMKTADPWTRLAAVYRVIGDQLALDKLLEHHPEAAAGVADLYAADKDWEHAIAAYSKAITPETKDADLLARRAYAYQQLEQWEPASADWEQAESLNPGGRCPIPNPDGDGTYRSFYLESQAVCHRMLKQYAKAVAAWTKMLDKYPNSAWVMSARGQDFGAMGEKEAALSDLNKAAELAPNIPEIRRRRGEYFASLGEWQLAVEDYTAAPSGWTISRNIALLKFILADSPGHRAFAARLLEQVGDNPDEQQTLWLTRIFTVAADMVTPENCDRLLRMADKLTDQKPRLMAAIHFRHGDAESAVQLFDQNRLEMPYLFLAAMAHHKQGNIDRAKQLLNEANTWLQQQRDQDPDNVIPQGQTWQDWAVCLILQREAESLINGKPDPAPASPDDKTSPARDPESKPQVTPKDDN